MEKRFHCEHCNEKISKTLYYQHKQLYYSSATNSWTCDIAASEHRAEEEFSFSDDEMEITCEGNESIVDTETVYDNITSSSTSTSEEDTGDEFEVDADNDDTQLTELWIDDDTDDDENTTVKSCQVESAVLRMAKLYAVFILMWQTLFKVSDSGINIIFFFFAKLLSLLVSQIVSSASLRELAQIIPKNVGQAKTLIGQEKDSFSKYVSCPKCHTTYALNVCTVTLPNKTKESKSCSYVKYPHHPHARQRNPCNEQLMKRIRTSVGTISWYPRQTYCYQSVVASLKTFLLRPHFHHSCELWRNIDTEPGTLRDIYDGKVWKDFLTPSGVPFLSVPYNYALTINIDWFQPFKHSPYSAGAIYIAIQNLPRRVRYLTENVMLVGVIPGPHEPKGDINTYLKPLVNELKELWTGVVMPTASGTQVLVRAALICVSCDIPASRKVSGFVGHNAYRACSRCLKPFPTEVFGQKADFTGTDRSNWTKRSTLSHRDQAQAHKEAITKAQQKLIEREHGCRYSVLLELPYFDVVRFSVIDPMHNLLLGTAKHVLSVWTSLGILDKTHYLSIQENVDRFVTPPEIGRIPSKIASGFSSFTADQWRNWTLIYSLCSLKGIIPHKDYDCWLLFVKAVNILCQRQITLINLEKGDSLLMDFCKLFEQLYGQRNYTINMHLHAHLMECVLDFGPVYSFWLFSFERLNGVLGSYHTNCKNISLQLMRRFMSGQYYGADNWPIEFREEFYPLLVHHTYDKGSLKACSLEQALAQTQSRSVTIKPSLPIVENAWESYQKDMLNRVKMSVAEGHNVNNCALLSLYESTASLTIDGFVLGSVNSRYVTKCHVMACNPNYPDQLHLAKIERFYKINVKAYSDNSISQSSFQVLSEWIAYVTFYDEHNCKLWFGGPTQVWARSLSTSEYVRLSSIKKRVAFCETDIDFGRIIGTQRVLVVSLLSN